MKYIMTKTVKDTLVENELHKFDVLNTLERNIALIRAMHEGMCTARQLDNFLFKFPVGGI